MEFVTTSVIAERLAALPVHEPRVVVSGNFATPFDLLAEVTQNLEQARLFVLNPQAGWPSESPHITETPFIGPGARHAPDVEYIPMRLSLVPKLFATSRPPDVVLIQTSTPLHGKVSLGIEVNLMPAAIEQARARGGLVIAQINSEMPYTFGDGEISVEHVDLAIEIDQPLPSPATHAPDDAADLIGERIGDMATDGCTIQVGIGQLPDAALGQMRSKRELAVWSELISDGILELERIGCLNRSRPMISTFLFGSQELYEWAHRNPRLEMRRTEIVNDPSNIAAQPQMLSINTALEVDLFAQANASYVRGEIYSGFGGQPDFVAGALHAQGGHSVIALRSWHDKSGSSSVLPVLTNPTCSFQHSAIISEHGRADLLGQSQLDQSRAIIEHVADPRARDALRDWAGSRRLW
jgi:acyl-CoA hydrolase